MPRKSGQERAKDRLRRKRLKENERENRDRLKIGSKQIITNRRGRKTDTGKVWDGTKYVKGPLKRGQNLPASASEGKGKGPESNPVGSKPNPKSAENRYDPGDLSKNPKKAYYSSELGRYVTGAGIKAQAAADRKEMLKNQQKTKTQQQLEKTHDAKLQQKKVTKPTKPKLTELQKAQNQLKKMASGRNSVQKSKLKLKIRRLQANK